MKTEDLNIQQAAQKYIEAGLAVLPTRKNKQPLLRESWKNGFNSDKFLHSYGIGIICGRISGNLECFDFDNHFGDAEERFRRFINDDRISGVVKDLPHASTVSGGFHLIYRCPEIEGNQKLAQRKKEVDGTIKQDAMIETRGEGGYFCSDPTPGYKIINGDLCNIPTITPEQRKILFQLARSFNEYHQPPRTQEKGDTPWELYDNDPVAINKTLDLMKSKGWTETKGGLIRPGKTDGISATYGKIGPGRLYVFSTNAQPFVNDRAYSPSQVLALLKFDGDFKQMGKHLAKRYRTSSKKGDTNVTSLLFKQTPLNDDSPDNYIRVGDEYYKKVKKSDALGNLYDELALRKRQTLVDDKIDLQDVRKYDLFTNIPDHQSQAVIPDNHYNIYKPMQHEPIEGSWDVTEKFLKHIFGDQFELGLDYLQLLYLKPTQILPILCLVSKETMTGKTTFLNYLSLVFQGNVVIIGNQDIESRFNSLYAVRLIIAVDESKIEQSKTLERLKAMATQTTINLEEKYLHRKPIPYFGKIILCSNYEENFIQASDDEVRYWVRKLSIPIPSNANMIEDLKKEIPHFLYHLSKRKISTEKQSRMWFLPSQIQTNALQEVKEASKSWLYKEIKEYITDQFLTDNELKSFQAAVKDIKVAYFSTNYRVTLNDIRQVLKRDFKKAPSTKNEYYSPFNDGGFKKQGRPYTFARTEFITDEPTSDKIDDNSKDNLDDVDPKLYLNF